MRVLLVNQYFPPDTSATAVVFGDVVRALGARGHEVTVLCGRASYDPTERSGWRPVKRERAGEARVLRVGSSAFDRRRAAGRVVNYLTFLVAAVVTGALRPRPDVVVVGSDPPLAVLVALVAARGRPVVYSLRDLHPDMALAAGMARRGLAVRAWSWVHDSALRRCRIVICLGETMAERVRAKGIPSEQVEVVADGAWPPSHAVEPGVVAELRAGAEFVALHAGNIGGALPWETLAGAAEALEPGSLIFVGDGARADLLRRRAVRVVPFRPPEELASVMAAGDVHIVALRSDLAGLVVPSKLFTVLAHGRPVLAVAPETSEVAHIVRKHRCGVVADPDDAADVADRLRALRGDRECLEELGERARAAGKAFERSTLLARFAVLVEEAAGAHRSDQGRSRGSVGREGRVRWRRHETR